MESYTEGPRASRRDPPKNGNGRHHRNGNGAKRQGGKPQHTDLSLYLEEVVYPALYDRLEDAFPEFSFIQKGGLKEATCWPPDFPMEVEDRRPARLQCYSDSPHMVWVHGHHHVRWLDYVNRGRRPTGPDFIASVQKLCELAGVPFPEREMTEEEKEQACKWEERRALLVFVMACCREAFWSPAGEKARDYLKGRGFTDDDLRELGVGFYPEVAEIRAYLHANGCDANAAVRHCVLTPKLTGFVVVPWNDPAGGLMTLYGRWAEKDPPLKRDHPGWRVDRDRARGQWDGAPDEFEEPVVPKTFALPGNGTKASPLFFDRARRAGHQDTIVGVEGLFDAALLQSRGETRAVAYVAAQFDKGQVETLARYRVKHIIIVPDPDGGGDKGTLSSIRSLRARGVGAYVAKRLPDGLDPDEFLARDGIEGWHKHIDDPTPGYIYEAESLLSGITPQSPGIERRKAVERLSDLIREIQRDIDRREVIRLACDRTGFGVRDVRELLKLKGADRREQKTASQGPGGRGGSGKATVVGEEKLFANYTGEKEIVGPDGKPKVVKIPSRMEELDAELECVSPEWPKRVVETLFIPGHDYRPTLLQSPSRLFAWLNTRSQVDWIKGSNVITQEQFFEHRRMSAEPYEAIETVPQWPPLPGVYYMHEPVPRASSGNLLDQLLDRFNPLTPVDRELIRALIFTLFWGGPPGSRPAFLVTAADDDPKQGRGIGKSHLIAIIAEGLAGGFIDASPTDQISEVKTRLLSPEARQIRIARLDNVKTLRFSWGDLEGLITSPLISGRELYAGEGRRPNTLVWAITLNGASLSKDMAQRVCVIKLRRPTYDPMWESDVREFIGANRPGLLAEIRNALEDEPGIVEPTRWAIWERNVLSKTDDLPGCQRVIIERQGAIDDDQSEKDLVSDFFAEKLRDCKHMPEVCCVQIPSGVVAEWLSEATRKFYATNAASAHIQGLGIPQLTKSDKEDARGWVWRGINAPRDIKPVPLGVVIPRRGNGGAYTAAPNGDDLY